jgi:hypothetical protein
MQRKQQEQEVTFIQNKENKEQKALRSESNNSALKKSLYMRGIGGAASSAVVGGDHIPHGGRENFAFRLPTQTNLP